LQIACFVQLELRHYRFDVRLDGRLLRHIDIALDPVNQRRTEHGNDRDHKNDFDERKRSGSGAPLPSQDDNGTKTRGWLGRVHITCESFIGMMLEIISTRITRAHASESNWTSTSSATKALAMRLSTIQTSLAKIGMKPTRSLGQNFLHDQNLGEWIVAQLDLQPDEPWVELGPGLGALTEFALERSRNALLIEKDRRMVDFLRERFSGVEIVHGDAGEFDVRELFARGPVKVLGNLPYYVSSQILFQFTAEPSPVRTLVFTLQKELAERLSATPRTKAYGALTLLIGRRWRVKYLRTLPGKVFFPAPNVIPRSLR
jgi:hypothetical protein